MFRSASRRHSKFYLGLIAGCVSVLALTLTGCAGYVTSAGGSGNPGTNLAPVISGVTSGNAGSTGAVITWTTNVASTSQVNYGTTASYGQSTGQGSNLATSHSVTLAGLTPSTLYHYQVASKDSGGSQVTSGDLTFTTAASNAPPVISGVSTTGVLSTGATITWTTNVGATSQVNYGTTTSYGQSSALNSSLVTSHSVTLSGLTGSTLYHFQVVSKDTNGNQASSSDFTFTTGSSTPPTISAVAATNVTMTGATITWTTNVGATSQVKYGTTTSYGQNSSLNSSLVTSHSVTLSALVPSTLYHYQVVSKDGNGNQAASGDSTFTTQVDTVAPSVPTGLSATAVSSSQINLTWTASTDNAAVAGYKVLRGGNQVGTSTVASYSDTGLSASTAYTYTVEAYDASGNTSAQSASASATTLAANASCASGLPCALGWYQIPNTSLSSLCPNYSDIQGATGCTAVMGAWGSALVDTKRNRLIVHGGGHSDYYGNEIYAVDFNTTPISTVLVKDASHGAGVDSAVASCAESFPDGTPNSRHDYNGLWYLPTQDQYWLYGAGVASCGSFSDGQWVFTPATGTWKQLSNSTHPMSGQNGSTGQFAYDSMTDSIYDIETNTGIFWKYTIATNVWTNLTSLTGCNTDNGTSVIDTAHRLYLCVGNGDFHTISLNAPYAVTDVSTAAGCSSVVAAHAPGFAYDPVQQMVVGYLGGDSVLVYDPVAKTCNTVTYPGGPTTVQSAGTYGRFQYMPGLGGFVYAGSMTTNVYFLRLLTPAAAAAQDFANRCAAPGVIYCEPFDNPADFTHLATNQNQSGLFQGTDPNCAGTSNCYGAQDTTTARSGVGSLLFTIPGAAGADPSGFWKQLFAPNLTDSPAQAQVFGQNSSFYISYAQRMDAPYISNQWPASGGGTTYWKQQIISSDQSTCGNIEITTVNAYNDGYPQAYSQCGADGFQVQLNGQQLNESSQFAVTGSGRAGFNCPYKSVQPDPQCFDYPVDVWATYYYTVSIGTWGSANSNIFAYVSTPSSTAWQQWIYMANHTLFQDAGLPAYDTVTLIPYWTGRDSSVSAGPTSHTWYDELIISTQPIAPPQTPPAMP